MQEDAVNASKHAKEKLTAKSVVPGKYDLVLDPDHLGLTIHESVGHPLELDRVLGYEANYAGTSFATLDKWKSGDFKYGSDKVNIVADKIQPLSLGNTGYDDEGVKCKEWGSDQRRNLGKLPSDSLIRPKSLMRKNLTVAALRTIGSSVQFQRMPNVSLKPGTEKLSVAEMVKNVEKAFTSWVEARIQSISSVIIFSLADSFSTKSKTEKLLICLRMWLISLIHKSLEFLLANLRQG